MKETYLPQAMDLLQLNIEIARVGVDKPELAPSPFGWSPPRV